MLIEIFSHSNQLLVALLLIMAIYFGFNLNKKNNSNILYITFPNGSWSEFDILNTSPYKIKNSFLALFLNKM